eukprot:scaffold10857_cov137-Alexandrium_tamarense.AAC.2
MGHGTASWGTDAFVPPPHTAVLILADVAVQEAFGRCGKCCCWQSCFTRHLSVSVTLTRER